MGMVAYLVFAWLEQHWEGVCVTAAIVALIGVIVGLGLLDGPSNCEAIADGPAGGVECYPNP